MTTAPRPQPDPSLAHWRIWVDHPDQNTLNRLARHMTVAVMAQTGVPLRISIESAKWAPTRNRGASLPQGRMLHVEVGAENWPSNTDEYGSNPQAARWLDGTHAFHAALTSHPWTPASIALAAAGAPFPLIRSMCAAGITAADYEEHDGLTEPMRLLLALGDTNDHPWAA